MLSIEPESAALLPVPSRVSEVRQSIDGLVAHLLTTNALRARSRSPDPPSTVAQ